MCLRQSLPLECNYSPFNHFQASARVAGQLPRALTTHHFLMDTTISTGTCSCSLGRMLLGGWLLCDLKLQKHHILLKPQCQSPAYGKNSRGGRMAPPHQGSDLGPEQGWGRACMQSLTLEYPAVFLQRLACLILNIKVKCTETKPFTSTALSQCRLGSLT